MHDGGSKASAISPHFMHILWVIFPKLGISSEASSTQSAGKGRANHNAETSLT